MTEINKWFHDTAREAECNIMIKKIKLMKSSLDNKRSKETERDLLIMKLALLLGVDEKEFPTFLNNITNP